MWTEHCRRHGLVALARHQTLDYQINHVNLWGPALLPIREHYRNRDDVGPSLNKIGPYKGPRSAYRKMVADVEAAVRVARTKLGLRKARSK